MASTTGYVQEVKLTHQVAWIYIGNTLTNTQLFHVPFNSNTPNEAALLSSMVDTLTTCMVRGLEVEVFHGDSDSAISIVIARS